MGFPFFNSYFKQPIFTPVTMPNTFTINSIAQACKALGLDAPKHPLVNITYASEIKSMAAFKDVKVVNNLYQIMLKQTSCGTLLYGRNSYDYEEGTLVFTAPGQVMEYDAGLEPQGESAAGWVLAFHPDLIRKSDLGAKIDQYTFFDYDVTEALHLSDEELVLIEELLEKIKREYSQNLDRHSQHLINANIGLLLDYCLRFYDRQFYTRTNINTDVVSKFEQLLKHYYDAATALEEGIPSVAYCANALNLSANYLSDLLKKETGKTAQEHIHLFVIEKAKNSLLSTNSSVSEIGYALGFEYPQHFSNLFKAKTGMSPREYRQLN